MKSEHIIGIDLGASGFLRADTEGPCLQSRRAHKKVGSINGQEENRIPGVSNHFNAVSFSLLTRAPSACPLKVSAKEDARRKNE